jgi:hypothetical protein
VQGSNRGLSGGFNEAERLSLQPERYLPAVSLSSVEPGILPQDTRAKKWVGAGYLKGLKRGFAPQTWRPTPHGALNSRGD